MQGFDFLGQQVRKYRNGKLIIKPSQKSLQGLQEKVRHILEVHRGDSTWEMIRRLNQTIGGWSNYHRHICASRTFHWFDNWLFISLKRWLHYRHPDKGHRWLMKRYYRVYKNSRWSFHATKRNSNGKIEYRDLLKAGWINIIRHVKIKAAANPFDTEWIDYFDNRKGLK